MSDASTQRPVGTIAPANLHGAAYMLLAMAGFTINDSLIKGIGDALPVWQVIAVRGVLLLMLMAVFLAVTARRGTRASVAVHQGQVHASHWKLLLTNPKVLARALCELLATIAFFMALLRLPLAVLSAVLQAMPLLVTAGAAVFLGQEVGWRRWLAIGIGFLGVLIILRPGATAGFAIAALLPAVACVVASAARDLFTRSLAPGVPSMGVTVTSAIVITSGGIVGSVVTGEWQSVSAWHWLLLISAAVFLFAGMQGIVMAMRAGDVAAVVPYRYTGLLWAVGLGWVFFSEIPDVWTIVGASIVVGSGLYTFARERRLERLKHAHQGMETTTRPLDD